MSSEDESSSSPLSPCSNTTSSPPLPSCHFVGKRDDIMRRGRVTKRLDDCRDVLVLYHQGLFHAMDMRCYHRFAQTDAGGALESGDIEEFDGRLCIVCPWHKYKITLAEGEGLYQAVENPTVKPLKTHWRSKGVKQRIHKVTEINGDVFVILNDSSEAIESDHYQTARYQNLLHAKTKPLPRS